MAGRRSRRRRPLTVAASLVAVLAALKAIDGGSDFPSVVARVAAQDAPAVAESTAEAATEPSAEAAATLAAMASQNILVSNAKGQTEGDVDLCNLTSGDLELLQQLADRRDDLDRREHDLGTREQALQVVENRIEDKLGELKSLQATVEATLDKRDEAQEQQLGSLVKIYENMKPKDAAPIFDALDMPILLDVIDRMKEAKAAPVLALMNPDRVREVTKELARRRDLPATSSVVSN